MEANGSRLNYHLHSIFPRDRPLTPLYGLYVSPVILSCSTLRAENVCEGISKRICRACEGRGADSLSSKFVFQLAMDDTMGKEMKLCEHTKK